MIVGVDIGGANLKYASSDERTFSRSFAMWKRFDELSAQMAKDLKRFGPIESLAVTITGELADCFLDRGAGIQHIVESVEIAAPGKGRYYCVAGNFLSADEACRRVDDVAASNWHALASFVGREISDRCLLIDIGSTTTDIIPLAAGKVATVARTDFDRLVDGSLVYVGCGRTPVCSLVDQLTYRGQSARVMNEFFATVDDVRLVLGCESEDQNNTDTADEKPRTVFHAINRLARMIGLDHRSVTIDDARSLATEVQSAVALQIQQSVDRVFGGQEQPIGMPYVTSGHGEDLLPASIQKSEQIVRLSDLWGNDIARCAPAFAVAKLLET